MLTFNAEAFLELAKEIGRINSSFAKENRDLVLSGSPNENNIVLMKNYKERFQSLGLHLCRMQADRILGSLTSNIKSGEFSDMLAELYNRLFDECSLLHLISISGEERRL